MNREFAILFIREGATAPETVRGIYADTEQQARTDFERSMDALGKWSPDEAKVTIITVRELPNPARKYSDKEEAAYELHLKPRGIDQLITDGFLPRPHPHARCLWTWEELERARTRKKVA